MPKETVFLVPLDAKPAHLLVFAPSVSTHLSFKEMCVKLNAIMDLLLLAQSVEDALKDAFNALKISYATTVLTVFTNTTELAIRFVLLELLEIALQPTGFALPVILLAKLASIILLIAPAAKTEKAIFKLQPSCNPVFKHAMMELLPTMESVRSAILSALPALEAPVIVSPALKDNSFIKEDVGPHALEFFYPTLELKLLVSIPALKDSTNSPLLLVLLALFNAHPVMEDLTIVPHAYKDQSPLTELAQLSAVKTSSASLEFALLVMNLAMDVQLPQLIVNHVLLDM